MTERHAGQFRRYLARRARNTRTLLWWGRPPAFHTLVGDFVAALRRQRRRGQQPLTTFDDILAAWEMDADQLPCVQRGLLVEGLAYAALGALALGGCVWAVPAGHWLFALASAVFTVLGTVGCLTRLWRRAILVERRWIDFTHWLSR